MELSALSLPRISLLTSSSNPISNHSRNTHHPRFPLYPSSSHRTRCPANFPKPFFLLSFSISGNILRPPSPTAPPSSRFASISRSPALSGSGGGGDGLAGAGGGGGGDGCGEAGVKSLAGESDDVPALGTDAIVLHVGGMACGGCAASVKRILESQPQVSSATVIFDKETAFVWTVPEVKVTQDWKQQLGKNLAKHLTTCGFTSDLHGGYVVDGETKA